MGYVQSLCTSDIVFLLFVRYYFGFFWTTLIAIKKYSRYALFHKFSIAEFYCTCKISMKFCNFDAD